MMLEVRSNVGGVSGQEEVEGQRLEGRKYLLYGMQVGSVRKETGATSEQGRVQSEIPGRRQTFQREYPE